MSSRFCILDDLDPYSGDEWPEGLVLYRKFILIDKCLALYNYVDKYPYLEATGIQREVQHYGFIYDYNFREPHVKKLNIAPAPPPVLKCLADTIYEADIMKCYPNQIIVNKYLSGQGISPHRDHYPIFDTDIGSLSLGSVYVMTFKHHKSHPDFDPTAELEIALPIGSLLVFADDARMNWTHEIKKKKSDNINGKRILRGTRISCTFRTVVKKCQNKVCKIEE